tara:strand:- start:673 stop:1326 length:654 start_codon:yes stop_codon:yes gene_type:complete
MATKHATKPDVTTNGSAITATPPLRIALPQFKLERFLVPIVGDSPLLMHNFSSKTQGQIRRKHEGEPREKKFSSPQEQFEDAKYLMPDGSGYAMPAIAFKKAAVSACSFVKDVTKVVARGMFHVDGQWVRINHEKEPVMRTDPVRLSGPGNTADIRHRPEFWPWSAEIPVTYNPSAVSAEQICYLFQWAGFSVGIGDWRTQKDGTFGRFHVKTDADG